MCIHGLLSHDPLKLTDKMAARRCLIRTLDDGLLEAIFGSAPCEDRYACVLPPPPLLPRIPPHSDLIASLPSVDRGCATVVAALQGDGAASCLQEVGAYSAQRFLDSMGERHNRVTAMGMA